MNGYKTNNKIQNNFEGSAALWIVCKYLYKRRIIHAKTVELKKTMQA